jgi:hypothetical protein
MKKFDAGGIIPTFKKIQKQDLGQSKWKKVNYNNISPFKNQNLECILYLSLKVSGG